MTQQTADSETTTPVRAQDHGLRFGQAMGSYLDGREYCLPSSPVVPRRQGALMGDRYGAGDALARGQDLVNKSK